MIRVEVADLASVDADAVVRPATALLEPAVRHERLETLGTARQSWSELPHNRPLDVGAAVVTTAGGLAAEFVIHAVVSSPTKPVTVEGVRQAVRGVLLRAQDWELRRIATPLLGRGKAELSLEDAARALVDEFAQARSAIYPDDVCIVVESETDRSVVEAFIRSRFAYES